ncbi:ThiF family adenylyltransferase [Candidatus Chloroploca sp. Khr17]|uniref:HesA/MoeB/ThiF family protein n=1 Tax=Candidatus Chloroploca sp. Khr17 TaxID=2496869 RepID=UPI00101CF1B5|nr:ThiF family adenylyltransferase [Candidatus Chloroploca sp. Khr17]
MFLTVPDSLINQLLGTAAQTEGKLYGYRYDDGDVVQIRGILEASGAYLGRWYRSPVPPTTELAPEEIVLNIDDELPDQVAGWQSKATGWETISCNVIRLHTDYASRMHGIFEVSSLANTCIAVIGLGSGGSVVASQLARCGVGQMRLVDFDRLKVHNIARHACGLHDIGRYKTRALRDLLYDISPAITVETYELNVLGHEDQLATIVTGCDLVVVATDHEDSKLAVNTVCWPRGIPAIYAAAYNRAFGGDIFRAIPSEGACYACFQTVIADFFGPPPAATQDFSLGYEDPARMEELLAQPGLGVDVGMIALLMARMALLTLLRDKQNTLPDLPTNWLLFGNRAEWIFQQPLESLFIDVPKNAQCPVCNYSAFVAESLKMSEQEAAAEASDILADLPVIQLSILPNQT